MRKFPSRTNFGFKATALIKKILVVIYSGSPQVFGLILFLLTMRYAGTEKIAAILPSYQTAMSFSSIFFLGTAYSRNVFKLNFITYLSFLSLSSVVFALINYKTAFSIFEPIQYLVLAIVCSLSIFQYISLHKYGAKTLLHLNVASSALLPMIFFCSFELMLFIFIFIFIAIRIFLKDDFFKKHKSKPFNFEIIGCIISQIPFLAYPILDSVLIQNIGPNLYIEYTSISKITLGLGIFCFAHFQQFILEKNYKFLTSNIFKYILIGIPVLMFAAYFCDNLCRVALQCIAISISINMSSLIMRSLLMTGQFSGIDTLWSVLLLSFYSFLVYGDILIFGYANSFLIYLFVMFYLLGIRLYPRAIHKFTAC